MRGEALMDIARMFGLSRHSSVSDHIRKVEKWSTVDRRLKRAIDSIVIHIKGTSNADLTPTGG